MRTLNNYCLLARGLTYSAQQVGQTETAENNYDTQETIEQVERHNITYERTCPNTPPE